MTQISPKATFQSIADAMVANQDGVEHGKMMSHPAIAYRGRVFAFYGLRDDMGFRLDAGFDFPAFGITEFEVLAPFKTKPPMKDWFRISANDAQHWPALAEHALQRMCDGA